MDGNETQCDACGKRYARSAHAVFCEGCGKTVCLSCVRSLVATRRGGGTRVQAKGCPFCSEPLPTFDVGEKFRNTVRNHREKISALLAECTGGADAENANVPSSDEIVDVVVQLLSKKKTRSVREGYDVYANETISVLLKHACTARTPVLLRRKLTNIFHSLWRDIDRLHIAAKETRERILDESEKASKMYPFTQASLIHVDKDDEKHKDDREAPGLTVSTAPAFDPETLAACQLRLRDLGFPHPTVDLNRREARARVVLFIEYRIHRRLKQKHRSSLERVNTDWDRKFVKYLRILKCPSHVIEAPLKHQFHWFLRDALKT